MTFALAFCPICSLKLDYYNNDVKDSHFFTCPKKGDLCTHITFKEDWSFEKLSFYPAEHLPIIEVRPETVSIIGDGTYPHKTDLLNFEKTLDLVKTLLIFQ